MQNTFYFILKKCKMHNLLIIKICNIYVLGVGKYQIKESMVDLLTIIGQLDDNKKNISL